MLLMALSRCCLAGCRNDPALICWRMSGDALTSTHSSGRWPAIAIEDCVRGSAAMEPLRSPEQLRQLQFHWGNPPPAADPSMVIFTIQRKSPRSARAFVYSQAISDSRCTL